MLKCGHRKMKISLLHMPEHRENFSKYDAQGQFTNLKCVYFQKLMERLFHLHNFNI